MIADLPEPARRDLSYSVALGTPISATIELKMRGLHTTLEASAANRR